MPVEAINSPNDFKSLINADKPVLVDFWAPWCGPCKQIAPILENLSGEHDGEIVFAKVNVDEQGAISQEAGVRAMPTFIVYKNGQKVKELVGANPQGLQNLVKEATRA